MTEKDVEMKDTTKVAAKTDEVKQEEPVDPFFGKLKFSNNLA